MPTSLLTIQSTVHMLFDIHGILQRAAFTPALWTNSLQACEHNRPPSSHPPRHRRISNQEQSAEHYGAESALRSKHFSQESSTPSHCLVPECRRRIHISRLDWSYFIGVGLSHIKLFPADRTKLCSTLRLRWSHERYSPQKDSLLWLT